MSTIIKLRCIDQVLTFESTPVIASGGLEVDFLEVEFCSKWDGLAKTAVFWRTEEEAYHVPLDESGVCPVPPEVLVDEGAIYFGLFGVSEGGRQRTSEVMRYMVVKGAITSGTKPSEPTADIYAQLLAKYAEVLNGVQEVVDAAEASRQAAEQAAAAAEETAATAEQAAAQSAATEREIAASAAQSAAAAAAAQSAAEQAATKAAQEVLDVHVADKSNPHGVTAAQAGALPITGGVISGAAYHSLDIDTTAERNYIYYKINGTVKASTGWVNGIAGVANEGAGYARIGVTDEGVPEFWTGYTASSKHYPLLHSGNFHDYGGSNPNLLDNWYFGNPVNQRGGTAWSNIGYLYMFDRWKGYVESGGSISVVDGGLELNRGSSSAVVIRQMLETYVLRSGYTYTISFVSGNELFTKTFTWDGSQKVLAFYAGSDYFNIMQSGVSIYCVTTKVYTIKAVKLELGDTQTIAHQDADGNWVLNDPPPDKGLELLKCIQSTADSSDGMTNKVVLHTGNLDAHLADFDIGQIVIGSYVGTGTFGSANPTSLTFDKPPKWLSICDEGGIMVNREAMKYTGVTSALTTTFKHAWCDVTNPSGYIDGYASCSEDRKTISWYVSGFTADNGGPAAQCNISGKTYYYIAIC